MLYATKEEEQKIVAVMETLFAKVLALPANREAERPLAFVRLDSVFKACKLKTLWKNKFAEEVADIFFEDEFCDTHGCWYFFEHGDGLYCLMRLLKAGESSGRRNEPYASLTITL